MTAGSGVHVYSVTVPDAAAGVLAGAQRQGESQEQYVKRAFLAGAVGLMNQKAALEARSIILSNQLAQAQAKLAADIATANDAAAKRVTTLTNALNAVQSQLK